MMKNEQRDFDSAAASWDEEPGRVKLATDIANAIMEEIPMSADMDALDFGCGTGLVTTQLQPFVHSITAIDGSQGMLNILSQKIEKMNLTNVRTQFINMDEENNLEGRYHLIVSSMTLHHIKNPQALLNQFYKIALPSSYVCIADLDSEGGLFHGDNRGVFHFGFDRTGMRDLFITAGFNDVHDRKAATVVKPDKKGDMEEFTVFLMTGRKNI